MNTTQELPAAPDTYAARNHHTGVAVLDRALAELAQQPWVEILSVNPGDLMPGSLKEDLVALNRRDAADEMDAKSYAVETMGLLEYHRSKLRIVVRALHFPVFYGWLGDLQAVFGIRRLPWKVELLPVRSSSFLFFALEFPYSDSRELEFFGSLLLDSLSSTPL